MNLRVHALEGVANFRDFGDYASRHGGHAPVGKLFRSAHHGAATAADLEAMGRLDLRTIVDLRRPSERRAQPSRRSEVFCGEVLVSDDGEAGEAPHVAFLRQTDLSAESVRAFYLDYYAKAPFEPRHRELFQRYFKALGRGSGGVLIHCTAGKDRTGLLAALTHHVLGVSEDDLFADYLLTNLVVGVEERLPAVALALEQTLGRKPTDAAARAFLGVDADFLAASLREIRQVSGSLDAYLGSLDITGSELELVRKRLLS